WFNSQLRIGDGGFFMANHSEIIFGRYPDVYRLKRGGSPEKFFEFSAPVRKIRHINEDRLLLIGEENCWLTDTKGEIIQVWNDVIYDGAKNTPLNRNIIFDADYKNGQLLLANWGNRSFDAISDSKTRQLLKLDPPLVPHWVAYFGDSVLLFSSYIDMHGTSPRPFLILQDSQGREKTIWKD
ncbi:MAG: hypothetical protein P8X57_14605, partial [Cyclobacteriaceae bacterium]